MAGSRAGLKRVKKTVRTKKGSAQRTYWVKATDAVKRAGKAVARGARGAAAAVGRHKGKIAAGAAVAAGLYGAHKYGHAAMGFARGVKGGWQLSRQSSSVAKAAGTGTGYTRAESARHALGVGALNAMRTHRSSDIGNRAIGAAKRAGGAASAAMSRAGDHAALTGLRAQRAYNRAGDHLALAGLRAQRAFRNLRKSS